MKTFGNPSKNPYQHIPYNAKFYAESEFEIGFDIQPTQFDILPTHANLKNNLKTYNLYLMTRICKIGKVFGHFRFNWKIFFHFDISMET